jgi:hypothetical protein
MFLAIDDMYAERVLKAGGKRIGKSATPATAGKKKTFILASEAVSDPPLLAVRAAYPAEPLLTVFHPPIEMPPCDHVATSTGIAGSTRRSP